MSAIKIPKEFQPGIKKLLTLDDETANNLLSILKETSPKLLVSDVAKGVTSKLTKISPKDVSELIKILVALHQVRSSVSMSSVDFAEELCQAIELGDDEDLKVLIRNRERTKDRLENFLVLKNLGVISKAHDILGEHQHTFSDARIITDIRSVFDDPKENPAAAAIVHVLKIHYVEGVEHKDFYVALDTRDIRKLRNILDRADQKAKSLKSMLEKSNWPYLDVE